MLQAKWKSRHDIPFAERDRFARRVWEHRDDLLRIAKAKLTNLGIIEPEDIVQEGISLALEKQHLYKEESKLRGWLTKIMFNNFTNRYRRKKKKPETTVEFFPEKEDGQAGAISQMGEKELLGLINKLPVDRKTPFNLHLKGYQYNEIADKLGVPIGTVKSRIYLARKQLQGMVNAVH